MKSTFEMKKNIKTGLKQKKLETSYSVMLEKIIEQEKNEIYKIISMSSLSPNKNWGILKTPN